MNKPLISSEPPGPRTEGEPAPSISAVVFDVLVALAEGEKHGYAIMQATGIRPGSLYRALNRLLDDGWIEPGKESADAGEDQRRRYYRLTPLGLSMARAEARRLAAQVATARAHHLLDAE